MINQWSRFAVKVLSVFFTAILAWLSVSSTALAECNSNQSFCSLFNVAAMVLPGSDSAVSESAATHNDVLHSKKFYFLSSHTAKDYQTIFSLQEQGEWDKADKIIGRLDNPVLFGHVLYQRYMHPTKYRASYDELKGWLDIYSDHPGAKRVYNLAMKRKPTDAKSPKEPSATVGIRMAIEDNPFSETDIIKVSGRNNTQVRQARYGLNQAKREIRRNNPKGALEMIERDSYRKLLSTLEHDYILGMAATRYMHLGHTDKALTLAKQAVSRSGNKVAQANWIAGLISWKQKNYKAAYGYFKNAASSEYASTWMLSSAAYWSARAAKASGNRRDARQWLQKAAAQPRTFYGLVAARSLGHDLEFEWNIPDLRANYIASLQKEPAGRRALALLDAGKPDMAESELKTIHPKGNKDLEMALIAVASHAHLPALSMRVAGILPTAQANAALYPIAPWKLNHTTGVDRALVSAFIRQESKFDPYVRNRSSGAVGLMQLMPRTASSLSKINFDNSNIHMLMKPEVNVALGQQYIAKLLNRGDIDNNLFYLAAAYNAGPGNLKKWLKSNPEAATDPLLFIESIPVNETRGFVQRVLSNYWMYSMRLGQDTPTLDMVADGKWPEYTPSDTGDTLQVAWR